MGVVVCAAAGMAVRQLMMMSREYRFISDKWVKSEMLLRLYTVEKQLAHVSRSFGKHPLYTKNRNVLSNIPRRGYHAAYSLPEVFVCFGIGVSRLLLIRQS